MKCFYHPESDAVGVCKACSKGVCTECAVDVGNGLACKEQCEDEVRAVNAIIEKNKKAYQLIAGVLAILGIVVLLMGLISSGIDSRERLVIDGSTFFGLFVLLIALLYYRSGRKSAAKRLSGKAGAGE
jgi:hypothetical protein